MVYEVLESVEPEETPRTLCQRFRYFSLERWASRKETAGKVATLASALLIFLAVIMIYVIFHAKEPCHRRVVAVFNNSDVSWRILSLTTHVVFSKLIVDKHGLVHFETEESKRHFFELKDRMASLKPKQKFLISVSDSGFNLENMKPYHIIGNFASSTADFVEKNQLDGVLLNFKLPTDPEIYEVHLSILEELYYTFSRERKGDYQVGITSSITDIEKSPYEIGQLIGHLGFINLQVPTKEVASNFTETFSEVQREKMNIRYLEEDPSQILDLGVGGVWVPVDRKRDLVTMDNDYVCYKNREKSRIYTVE
ncbi:hypothetical protein GCK72_005193 [Caenorhabditis remanei]|uniref:GH18 domain-containing protein n=1 Tax=Caenorhabditis remanei TaxID=31234 RepID=A0A6A5HEB6_CAERE|nr:hypothetical protein GCK72_005193 [Caenorhabditis remanei]KAF1765241.1 hypothetical protein GCK72_005193 [Caenorhabditis remanei]